MKKLLLATAIGAMLTAGVAIAMQTETAVPPKAPLTKAEMLARADARFDQADTNKDGQLSADERKGRGGRMLGRVDTNGDGLVSKAEHRAAFEARFARIDADKDGSIEAGERRGPGRGWGKRGHGRHMGMHGRGGPGGGRGMMMMADTNKDGAISKAEFDAASTARFAKLDTNKDGKLDRADRPARPTPPSPPAPPAGN